MFWILPDLNDTTPAAPDGHRNVSWQSNSTYTDNEGIERRRDSANVPNAWGCSTPVSTNYTPVHADGGKILPCTGTITVKLPTGGSPVIPAMFGSPQTQDADWSIKIQNDGSGVVTVDPNGCNLDGSASTVSLSAGQGIEVRVSKDGLSWKSFRGAGSGSGSLTVANTSFTTTGGAQTVAHGLGYSPSYAVISVGSDGSSLLGIVGWQLSSLSAVRWDSTNFYIYGSDAGIKGFIDSIR